MGQVTRFQVLLISVVIVGGIVTGFLIGWFTNNNKSSSAVPPAPAADPAISDILINEIDAERIETYLEYLTREPHIAGREVDEVKLVKYIKDKWTDFGLDVEVHAYKVLLSYPDQDDSNLISIVLNNGTEIEKSTPKEKVLDNTTATDEVVNPFNAYCGRGDVAGYLVYVNYGRVDDFIMLTRNLQVDPRRHICIARYGKIFRGSKARIAQDYGCAGLILYSDPIDYTVSWAGVYPDSIFLPGTGAQRGSLYIYKGDPLTPHYPAFEDTWRMWENETAMVTIPVTPIGYDDAIKYLEKMGGNDAPSTWQGGLNITYKLGPGFEKELNKTGKIKMHVTTKNELAVIHNVMGYIKGSVEPDRYVVIGNHRDAWVYGAVDPSSGTATMLEMSRSIGKAVKEGWKPRRTIVFASWGAEEFSLIGSNEWVEEFQKILAARTVAYINVDTSVNGNASLKAGALPNMNALIYESAMRIKNPVDAEIQAGRTTVYDTWAKKRPKYPNDPESIPNIDTLGSGSDYTFFIQTTGISSTSMWYSYDEDIGIASYPVYHSVYETFDLMKNYFDPGFRLNKAMAQLLIEMARRLVDEPVLPLNCIDYGKTLMEDKKAFIGVFGTLMTENGIEIGKFDEAILNFLEAARELHARIDELDTSNALLLRAVNDQLMYLDRAFIDMDGIGERTNYRHVIYAPSLHNSYGSSAFPGLADSLFDIEVDEDQATRWREVKRQYSILLFHIGSAASTLRDVYPIKGFSNKAK